MQALPMNRPSKKVSIEDMESESKAHMILHHVQWITLLFLQWPWGMTVYEYIIFKQLQSFRQVLQIGKLVTPTGILPLTDSPSCPETTTIIYNNKKQDKKAHNRQPSVSANVNRLPYVRAWYMYERQLTPTHQTKSMKASTLLQPEGATTGLKHLSESGRCWPQLEKSDEIHGGFQRRLSHNEELHDGAKICSPL